MQLSKSYQLIRKLASGGMAEVFLARTEGPRGFSKTLVLKRILPHLAGDEQFVEMFLGEARLVAQLSHPNVVNIYDFGEFEGSYYIAMEYIDGPNLRALARQAKNVGQELAPVLCAKLISYACEGLAYAHDLVDPQTGKSLGLVHRDVSSDNILVSRVGTVKVVDFGVAKVIGQGHRTKAGIIKGKLPYMPPEQLRGRPLDRRVDVYALGVVLYELLTCKRPFEVTGEAAIMNAILYEPVKPLRERRADIPEELARITERCLSKEREERYPSCRHLRVALERFIHDTGEPVGTDELASLVARLMPSEKESAAPLGSTSDMRAPPPMVRSAPLPASGQHAAKPPVFLPGAPPMAVNTGEVVPPVSRAMPAVETSQVQPAVSASASLELGLADTVPRRGPGPPQGRSGLVAMALGGLTVLIAMGAFLVLRRTTATPTNAEPPALAVAPPILQPELPQPPVATREPAPAEARPPPEPVRPSSVEPSSPEAPRVPQEEPPAVVSKTATPTEEAAPTPPKLEGGKKKRSPLADRQSDRSALAMETAPTTGSPEVSEAQQPPEAPAAHAPPAEPPVLASVVFKSSPPAQIRVNGRFAGFESVTESRLSPGAVRVEIYDSVRGFSKQQTFVLEPGDNGVHQVSVEEGTLELRIPSSTEVYLDGKSVGLAPRGPIRLYEGVHQLRLENKDLGKEVRKALTIRPGETHVFESNLEGEP